MPWQLTRIHPSARIAILGLVAFTLLGIRFGPNWLQFAAFVREVRAAAPNPEQTATIDRTILGGTVLLRGYYVMEQVRNLDSEIEIPNHKIVRWRLLFPALGHFLHLPGWVTLGLAHVGCLVLITALVTLGLLASQTAARPWVDACCFALAAGASAPFFTSMGWLGYYDSWLALGLLAAAFAPARWMVLTACLLTPWIDERFVIGLPLALLVRWYWPVPKSELSQWIKTEAVIPLLLCLAYGLARLHLGGSGSSQTVAEYFQSFVFSEQIPLAQYFLGAWSGLRFGWPLVLLAVLWGSEVQGKVPRVHGVLLGTAIVVVGGVGLLTALDKSRAMVLILPVVPLGWATASRQAWWHRFHMPLLLAIGALAVPASHVVGKTLIPVDNVWSPSQALLHAQNNFGVMYEKGIGVAQDATKAALWYRKTAEHGLAVAQSNLGVLYATGTGVPKDEAEAVKWYRQAADQGFAAGENNLGVMYAAGTGVPKDEVEAAKWYRRAAEQGHIVAQANLGDMYATGIAMPKDEAEAARWYRKAAERGHGAVQSKLGVMYATGIGVPKDEVEAAKWYRRAAEQGVVEAQNNLGAACAQGSGVPKDEAEAAKWYRMAAEQGYAVAQSNLGAMYATGTGVPKDEFEAAKWYRKAAEQGIAGAQINLGAAYAKGSGVPKDEAEAVAWYRRAAEQGVAMAQSNLAAFYYTGRGVPRDLVEAYAWLYLAIAAGHEESRRHLATVEAGMTNEQIAQAVALARRRLEALQTRPRSPP